MDLDTFDEAKILSRNYSQLRKNTKKWKLLQKSTKTQESISTIPDSPTIIQVSRDFESVDLYKISSLSKRASIRKNPFLLKSVHSFWEAINPYRLSGISEKTYKTLFLNLYFRLVKDSFEPAQIEKMMKNDQIIDFAGRSYLTFSDFYNGIFELIDSNTRSKLLGEYCHFSNQIYSYCEDSGWADGLNLYSKIHIEGKVNSYAPWMAEILRQKEDKLVLPKMLRTGLEIKVSERLLSQRKFKPVDRENFNIRKLEKIMSERTIKRKFRSDGTRDAEKKKKKTDRKALTFYSNHIDKISPLSTLHSVSRGKGGILESVIKVRESLKDDLSLVSK